MLNSELVLLIALAYLATLFAIAYFGDKKENRQPGLLNNAYVYSLSLAIYCTAWTYYGSVGRAATSGLGFLPIYLGPTLMAALWWFVLRKIVRISRTQRITSIADFIGSRYGKSALLASLVTVISVVGILPYIALQLKAISTSYAVIQHYPNVTSPASGHPSFWQDSAFYIALLLAAFTIVFGTRRLDITEQHSGMVSAVAFESLIKLGAFFAVGVYTVFFLFDGPTALFAEALANPTTSHLLSAESLPGGFAHWLSLLLISMLAVFLLPRQFHVAVVENTNESHIAKAMWLFPLYLLLINLFVLPIALGGLLTFPDGNVDPDTFVLTIPMAGEQELLTLLVFLGGLSAATGMVIVAAIALSIMVSNELIIPLIIRLKHSSPGVQRDQTRVVLFIRRATIIATLLLSYVYFKLIGESYALVTIGLISFVAAAQFAPAVLLGIYWKGANRLGAIAGLSSGFLLWAYTLFLPALAKSGWLSQHFVEHGLFDIDLLRPYALLGYEGLDPISHAVIWSLPINTLLIIIISTFTQQHPLEKLQAVRFVDIFNKTSQSFNSATSLATSIRNSDLIAAVAHFIGKESAYDEFAKYARSHGLTEGQLIRSSASLSTANHAEHLLAGVIGASNARLVIANLYQGESINIDEVLEILSESQEVKLHSQELERTSRQLRDANLRLQELDKLKDEIVATVSHELRTPLTSIRSFSEILSSTPDLSAEERQHFLQIMVNESERLTRLVDDILDIAKLESGSMRLQPEKSDVITVINSALESVSQVYKERDIQLLFPTPSVTPHNATLDRDRIQQVLINILSNAAKFCASGDGRVELSLDASTNHFSISIADNGPGISADDQATIFNRFRQIHNAQHGKPKGFGLGLAISKLIAEQHGGNLSVKSDGNSGTTFTLTLPYTHDFAQ